MTGHKTPHVTCCDPNLNAMRKPKLKSYSFPGARSVRAPLGSEQVHDEVADIFSSAGNPLSCILRRGKHSGRRQNQAMVHGKR